MIIASEKGVLFPFKRLELILNLGKKYANFRVGVKPQTGNTCDFCISKDLDIKKLITYSEFAISSQPELGHSDCLPRTCSCQPLSTLREKFEGSHAQSLEYYHRLYFA